MTKAIFLYHDDMDGRCCAAIAARAWRQRHTPEADVVYVPCDYGEAMDWEIFDGLICDDEVWVLDFSFDAAVMAKIEGTVGPRRLVWIDHHGTAIEKLDAFAHLPGIRKTTEAACLLTWIYCNLQPGEVPEAVRLIADRDMWRFAYGDRTRAFYEVSKLKDTKPWAAVWDEWLGGKAKIASDLAAGEIIYAARMLGLRKIVDRIGRPEPIHGSEQQMLLVNYPACGELGDVGRERGFAITHAYHDEVRSGRLVRVHSLYAGDPEIDVGALAKLRGGGGHRGASGWVEELK